MKTRFIPFGYPSALKHLISISLDGEIEHKAPSSNNFNFPNELKASN